MQIEIFSHRNGEELVQKEIKDEIFKIITEFTPTLKKGSGNELRKNIKNKLKEVGWSNDFVLDANTNITITSRLKDYILCLQTGNMSRFYADLLKIQYAYNNNEIKSAIYIIPSKEAAKVMGSNIANFNRFTFELNLFKNIISIPILVIGIN